MEAVGRISVGSSSIGRSPSTSPPSRQCATSSAAAALLANDSCRALESRAILQSIRRKGSAKEGRWSVDHSKGAVHTGAGLCKMCWLEGSAMQVRCWRGLGEEKEAFVHCSLKMCMSKPAAGLLTQGLQQHGRHRHHRSCST